jgi:hypothetical protein
LPRPGSAASSPSLPPRSRSHRNQRLSGAYSTANATPVRLPAGPKPALDGGWRRPTYQGAVVRTDAAVKCGPGALGRNGRALGLLRRSPSAQPRTEGRSATRLPPTLKGKQPSTTQQHPARLRLHAMGLVDLSDHTTVDQEVPKRRRKSTGLILRVHPVLVRDACAKGYI